MRPHVGAKTLARYRQGDLTARRNARIGTHLAESPPAADPAGGGTSTMHTPVSS